MGPERTGADQSAPPFPGLVRCPDPDTAFAGVIPWNAFLRVFCSLVAALFVSEPGISQTTPLRFEHLSMRQGLSNFSATSIAQDRQGFLWIGTEDGLNRYDGAGFTVYRNNVEDSTSLPANGISKVLAGQRGEVWIGTSGGLAVMHPWSQAPRRVAVRLATSRKEISFQVGRLLEDREGWLWIGTEDGILVLNPDSGFAVRAPLPDSVRVPITALTQSADGVIWAGTWGCGIFRFTREGDRISMHDLPPSLRKGFSGIYVPVMCVDSRDRLWIGTTSGLIRYDIGDDTPHRLGTVPEDDGGFPRDFIFDVVEDRSGAIWVGTFHRGLARFQESGETFTLITHDPHDGWSLTNDRVMCVFEDEGGILWVSTYRGGLNKHNPALQTFAHFTSEPGLPGGLPEDQVYAILEDRDGDIWFGLATQGLACLRKRTGQYVRYQSDPKNERTIADGFVTAIVERSNGDLWVGTGVGIDLLRKKTGQITHFRFPPVSPGGPAESQAVKTIIEDEEGIVWFGTLEGGLYRLNPVTGAMRSYRHDPNDTASLGGNGVFSLCLTSGGDFWVGTLGGGLNRLDRATGRFTRVRHDAGNPAGTLSSDGVYQIVEDRDGILWLGTFGGGLNRFDPNTGSFRHWTQDDGLPNNFVKSIIPDDTGLLWISTDNGLSRFDPREEEFKNFTTEDGLAGDVFLSGSRCKGRSGMLYFGGEGGVTGFNPQHIRSNMHVPPIVITAVSVGDIPLPLQVAADSMSEISLSYDQNTISFHFVALDFAAPAHNAYAWMVDGIDRDWVAGGTHRFARYTQILPGTYTFRVRGANADGLWNVRGAALTFTIRPPFWETLWFRLLVVALLGTAGTFLYRYRVNRLLEIERLRVRIASDLHDDIGASLSRIALQSELMTEGIEPEALPRYLRSIATISRELVTSMSDIVWSIDARNDTVEHLMTRIRDFAMSTLEACHVDFSFTFDGIDVHKSIAVEKRENLYLICKEAINNIAKHAQATQATINFRNGPELLTIVVADNGKGWGEVETSGGHGLRNMRMRAVRLGGSLRIEHHQGSRVILEVQPF
jgi:ligand-binding sensor domain-containing protein/signal transduction histidine kinase